MKLAHFRTGESYSMEEARVSWTSRTLSFRAFFAFVLCGFRLEHIT